MTPSSAPGTPPPGLPPGWEEIWEALQAEDARARNRGELARRLGVSRTVIRRVLAEMGLDLAGDTEVRVWDSSAEVRYLVMPERPPGTQGLGEDALAELVTRDSMIGVARVEVPGG